MNNKLIMSSLISLSLITTTALAATGEKVYASVNGKNITATDIAIAIGDPRKPYESLSPANKKIVLSQVIDQKLLSGEALKSSIVKSKQYKTTLKLAVAKLKSDLALEMWMADVAKKVKITDGAVKKFFNENIDRLDPSIEFQARHILVKTLVEANAIIAELKKSSNTKETFIKLAKEKSTGPSGKNGGDLGWFSYGKMVPSFSAAVSKLKKDTFTTTPVATRFGYHVIYTEGKRGVSTLKLKDATNKIKQIIGQETFKSYVGDALKNAKNKAKIVYK